MAEGDEDASAMRIVMADNRKVAPDELMATFQIPAVMVNRAIVTLGPMVRITFGEQTGDIKNTSFRVAVALPHMTAIELYRLLRDLLADIEKEIEAAKAEAVRGTVVGEGANG